MIAISKSLLKSLCHTLNRRCEGGATVPSTTFTATARGCDAAIAVLQDCAEVQQGDFVNMQQHENAEPEVSSNLPGLARFATAYDNQSLHHSSSHAHQCVQLQPHTTYDNQTNPSYHKSVAGQPESSGRLSSFDSIIDFLSHRLLNLHSTAASTMPLRPKLQEVYDKLMGMLNNTAETPGANHSFLLIGSRGTGKSLVCCSFILSIGCYQCAGLDTT